MILKYFLPKQNFTWKKLEEMSAKKKGKWTWPTQMQITLSEMGFDVVVIDGFDFDTFIERGGPFLIELWGKEMGEAQIKYSDIAQERRLFKKFREVVSVEKRPAQLSDIRRLLRQGYLVECGINSVVLSRRKGYAGHSVLIYHMTKNHVFLHNPGLPPHPNQKVSINLFKKAWAYPSPANKALTAVRWSKQK